MVKRRRLRKQAQSGRFLLRRIISGGETGADRAALWVGAALGLKTGGEAAPNYQTERGPRRSLLRAYGLVEGDARASVRLWKNVGRAQFVALFGTARYGGVAAVYDVARTNGVQALIFPLEHPVAEAGDILYSMLVNHGVRTMLVAGQRESRCPGIFKYTRAVLLNALEREWGNGGH
jgi:hypothetical protein